MAKLFLALALVALVGQSNALPRHLKLGGRERIVGGTVAPVGSVPHQVSMEYYGGHLCGGSILDANRVLTAAHCAEIAGASAFSVSAGLNNIRSPESGAQRKVKVSRYELHPNWDTNNLINDIAVLYLASPLQIGDSHRTRAVNIPSSGSAPNGRVTITGWGATSEGGGSPDTLRTVTVPVVDQAACERAYPGDIRDSMICAGELGSGGKDSCQGDSGGPLVEGNTLHGIVSWGIGCARPNYPGVYTRVAHFSSWINQLPLV